MGRSVGTVPRLGTFAKVNPIGRSTVDSTKNWGAIPRVGSFVTGVSPAGDVINQSSVITAVW